MLLQALFFEGLTIAHTIHSHTLTRLSLSRRRHTLLLRLSRRLVQLNPIVAR